MGAASKADATDPDNAGIRREPELPAHEEVVAPPLRPASEFEPSGDKQDGDAVRLRTLERQARAIARQATMDPGDDMGL